MPFHFYDRMATPPGNGRAVAVNAGRINAYD